jgi:hypothetical protein
MTVKTLHIKNPTPKLLEFVKKLQADKEAKLQVLDAKREKYFREQK